MPGINVLTANFFVLLEKCVQLIVVASGFLKVHLQKSTTTAVDSVIVIKASLT